MAVDVDGCQDIRPATEQGLIDAPPDHKKREMFCGIGRFGHAK
jgi:hypothetical protein